MRNNLNLIFIVMKNKILNHIFIAAIACLFAADLNAVNGLFGGGDGSPETPFIIEDAVDLRTVENNLSASYELAGNVDLTAWIGSNSPTDGWTPITGGFSGTLDGKGFVISELWINKPDVDDVGLFARLVNGASIKRIGLIIPEGKKITGKNYVGGLAGQAPYGSGTSKILIEECFVTGGTIEAVDKHAAGIMGYTASFTGETTIRNCYTANSTIISADGSGGILGTAYRNITIEKCYSTNIIKSSNNKAAGGLVGGFNDYGTAYTVKNSVALNPSVTSSVSNGRITGWVKAAGKSAFADNFAFYRMLVDGQTKSGTSTNLDGLSKTVSEVNSENTYRSIGWDFETVWQLGDGKEYTLPVLRNVSLDHQPTVTPSHLDKNNPPVMDENESLDAVTTRIRNKILSANYQDPTNLMNTMKSDGSWDNIDYQDQHSNSNGWAPGQHFSNLISMAIAYKHPESPFYGNTSLLVKIVSGCEFVYTWNYPKDLDNWWWNEIGDPQKYMVPLILIKGDVPSADIKRYSSFIKDNTGKTSHKGKNRTWVSEITIHKGCIESDYNLTMKGFRSMASVLSFADTQTPIVGSQEVEGIKADYSFHQHRRQVQSGSYGLTVIPDITNSMSYVTETLFANAFTDSQREILSKLLREGHMLFSYRRTMDFGTRGRAVTDDQPETGLNESELSKMLGIDPNYADVYASWINHLDGATFPTIGNKYFWESEIMTHHGANYYLSAKVISKRTNGTEMINGQNRRGFNLPLGATNILTTGKEYANIFPIWDWSLVPGTTAAQDVSYAALGGYLYGTSDFAGGVTDSISGVIAYQHDFKNLKANKAYFFMGDAMICVGSNITATHAVPVATSVNQCFKSGDINYYDGEKIQKLEGAADATNIQWIHHDNVGYIFPQQSNLTISGKNQTGSWRNISDNGSTTPLTKAVFNTRINHGASPVGSSYVYIVTPDKSLDAVKEYAENTGLEIVKNDSEVQVVYDRSKNQYGIVFYVSGMVKLTDDLSIAADKPCLILLKIDGKEYRISVADPTYSQNALKLTISKELLGEGVTTDPSKKETDISFGLPRRQYVGSTVAKTFTETEGTGINEAKDSNDIKIYPNPTSGVFFVEGMQNGDRISILNALGMTCFESIQKQIDISGLPSGIYYVKCNNTVSKIIKN